MVSNLFALSIRSQVEVFRSNFTLNNRSILPYKDGSVIVIDGEPKKKQKILGSGSYELKRKSTVGFSIGNILLDLLGGLTNYGQMAVQSIDQHSWVNFYGNIGKTLLSLVSIFFDILFIVQHYLLYPAKKTEKPPSPDPVNHESLI